MYPLVLVIWDLKSCIVCSLTDLNWEDSVITRGHFIGEIVDELSSVANQIATRSKIGMFDLNVFSENFFRDVLNALYGWKVNNLNQDRSNVPGLDLGDKEAKVAIQVTSRSDAAKVNGTLKKITPEQAKEYDQIFVFVAGYKQGSYTLDEALCEQYTFSEANILDVNDLCRKAMDLSIDKLQALHLLIRTNVAKLVIDLEIPDPETGKFPTSGFDKWEVKPEPKVGDAKKFVKWFCDKYSVTLTPEESKAVKTDLIELGQRLRRLPRVTREFLVMLFERRSPNQSRRFSDPWVTVRLATVEREYSGRIKELHGELGLLNDEGFAEIQGEDSCEYGEPEIGMRIPAKNSDDLSSDFLAYVEAKKLDLRKVLGQVDLSEF